MTEDMVYYVQIAKIISAGFTIAIGTIGPSIGQGMVASKACETIGKYPESFKAIRMALISGLFAIETASIYALLVVVFLLFVI